MVGKRFDRAETTSALAPRKFASAAAMVWFEIATCSSSALSCGSLYSSHHFARILSSPGSATFQPAPSLNAAGAAAGGFAYFGAGLHPHRSRINPNAARLLVFNFIAHLRNPAA